MRYRGFVVGVGALATLGLSALVGAFIPGCDGPPGVAQSSGALTAAPEGCTAENTIDGDLNTTNDMAAVQAAVDAAPIGGTVCLKGQFDFVDCKDGITVHPSVGNLFDSGCVRIKKDINILGIKDGDGNYLTTIKNSEKGIFYTRLPLVWASSPNWLTKWDDKNTPFVYSATNPYASVNPAAVGADDLENGDRKSVV